MSKTVLYVRTSTSEQTIEHQLSQAKQAGFTFDDVIEDEGVSGVSTPLAERPNGKRLFLLGHTAFVSGFQVLSSTLGV